MIVAIHQPHYLPWLRYVHKIASCDVFVLLDDAQYEKNGWQNRNRIKGPNGPVLLTVPLQHPSFQPIRKVLINNQTGWAARQWKSIQQCYGKASFFREYAPMLESGFARPWTYLAELNRHFLDHICRAFGITAQIISSSSLGVPGQGTARLVGICSWLGATRYLTGAYAAGNHLDLSLFQEAGIQVDIQAWVSPVYRQQYPALGFVPDLSALDLLMNEGPQAMPNVCSHPSDGETGRAGWPRVGLPMNMPEDDRV